jgi:hypothetical protein
VRFDNNRYSVPRRWAFRAVTVKGYVDRVEAVADGQVIATHKRSYGRREKVLDPLHFLVILGRKPAALDHAPVYRDWQLPAAFADLRHDLEARLGSRTGVQHFIRVIQLFARHSMDLVERAIQSCRARGHPDASAITAAVEQLARDTAVSLDPMSTAPNISVPLPDLSQFDRLLPHSPEGDDDHERCELDAVEGQPQTIAVADHAGRVGEAGP